MFGNGKTVLRAGAGMLYEQLSFDVFNGIGNAFGLRTNPTGAALYANGAQVPSPGSIGVTNISFTGAALTSKTTPGAVAYDWIHNGPSQPLYNFAPACGDGSITLPSGFKPQQCSVLMVDPNLRTPYVTDFSMGIQRAITNNISVDIGFVGNHGTKFIGVLDINQPPLGAGYCTNSPLTPAQLAVHARAEFWPRPVQQLSRLPGRSIPNSRISSTFRKWAILILLTTAASRPLLQCGTIMVSH